MQRFSKMHGAGNDFVVLDLRGGLAPPAAAHCRLLADRHFGAGCDQILTVEDPREPGSIASYRIWNSDGSSSQQCGNGARCIAAWLVRDGAAGEGDFALDSPLDTHQVERLSEDQYRIGMGEPRFDPDAIPLRGFPGARDQYVLDIHDTVIGFGAVSMGNPHAVIEVDDVDAAPVDSIASLLQSHEAFPESVNVGFAQVESRDRIRLRVYERGAGETLACGSGACAAAVVGQLQGLFGPGVELEMPGGVLTIEWQGATAPVMMTGPAVSVFTGEIEWPN